MSSTVSRSLRCPDSSCSFPFSIKKDGHYFRKNDSRKIQRFQCLNCNKKFSRATFQLEYRQKKRRVNFPLLKLLCSGVSQRRSALILGINSKTVVRKFDYLAKKYGNKHQKWLQDIENNSLEHIQFDDLITIEHTKLKPLTVTSVVNVKTREILAARVGKIPSFGHLAQISRRKYGKRENEHDKVLEEVFQKISAKLHPCALIQSDDHKRYAPVIQKFAPTALHKTYKGGRGCISGQGELKRMHYDPLFSINHTYAMLRANINRLIRKTWCTTKIPQKLQLHLDLYIWFHNQILLQS